MVYAKKRFMLRKTAVSKKQHRPVQTQKNTVWCTEHKSNRHSSEDCWSLHPEKRPKSIKGQDNQQVHIKQEDKTPIKYCAIHKTNTHTTEECSMNGQNKNKNTPERNQMPRGSCFRCGQFGHMAATCQNQPVNTSRQQPINVNPVYQQDGYFRPKYSQERLLQPLYQPPQQIHPVMQQTRQNQVSPQTMERQITRELQQHSQMTRQEAQFPAPSPQRLQPAMGNSQNHQQENTPVCSTCNLRGHTEEGCEVLHQQLRLAQGNIVAACSSATQTKPIMVFQLTNGKKLRAMIDSGAAKTIIPQNIFDQLEIPLIK